MKRIAIVACENSNTVCAGCACLNAFYDRRKSFERYAGEELRLMAFMRCSHCVKDGDPMQDAGFVEKLERFVSESVEIVHIGLCGGLRKFQHGLRGLCLFERLLRRNNVIYK